MPLFTFADRLAADASSQYILLQDGRYYRLRTGLGFLSAAESIRLSDLSQRLTTFRDDVGITVTLESHDLLAAMACLFFEDAPKEILDQHGAQDLISFVNAGMGETEDQPPQKSNADLGFLVMRVGQHFRVDPWVVYTTWPIWFLNAAIESITAISAIDSLHMAEAVAIGGGHVQKGQSRRTWQKWQRLASPNAKSRSMPQTKAGFEMMMTGLGLPRRKG